MAIKALNASYQLLIDNKEKELQLGEKKEQKIHSKTFAIDQIPSEQDVLNRTGTDIFKEMGIAFSLDPVAKATSLTYKHEDLRIDHDDIPIIVYRDQIPFIYNFFVRKADGNFKPVQSEMVELHHPKSHPGRIGYLTSAFGGRKLILNFSENYALNKVNLVNTSSAKALTDSTSNGIKESLTAFSEGLNQVSTIKATQRKMRSDELQNKVELLQKQKAIVDNQVLLDGAIASYEDVKRSNELKEEIAVLQKQKELLDANLSIDKANAINQYVIDQSKAETEARMLQSQIDNLSNQVKLLKQQKELEDIKEQLNSK